MKIVVEGYDGTGKSTVVKALALELGLYIHRAGPPPVNDRVAVENSVEQMLMTGVVHDRVTPISRQAYQLDIGDHHRTVLCEVLSRFHPRTVFVFCVNTDNDDNHEVKDYDTDEHIEHITTHKSKICANYEAIFTGIDHIRYDFRDMTVEDLICEVKRRLGTT